MAFATSMSGMSGMTSMADMASATSSAMSGMSTGTGDMGMGIGMDMGGTCKVSMLWNWYTIDACFLSSTWHIRSSGMFAASCIGVTVLVACLELLRRISKEYDAHLHRNFQRLAQSRSAEIRRMNGSNSNHRHHQTLRYITFKVNPLQQLVRAVLHAITFGLAYFIMLLAMYYNGYLIISIIAGAGLGKFSFDWMVHMVSFAGSDESKLQTADADGDVTVCCG